MMLVASEWTKVVSAPSSWEASSGYRKKRFIRAIAVSSECTVRLDRIMKRASRRQISIEERCRVKIASRQFHGFAGPSRDEAFLPLRAAGLHPQARGDRVLKPGLLERVPESRHGA